MADTKTPAVAKAAATAKTETRELHGQVGSPLHNTLTIAGREFRAYFNSPMGYIVMAVFTTLLGILFFFLFKFMVLGRATLQPLFTSMAWLLPLLCAAISMRTFAEERRLGTIELLITMPVRDGEVILGKFLGAMGLLCCTLAATLIYPIVVSRMGDLDMGPVVGGYLGLVLGGGAYIAIGMLVSSYSTDQISAFFLTLFISYFFFVLDMAIAYVGWTVAPILEYICFDFHFKSIARGVIDLRNVVFFLSVITACLLATVRSLARRRWS
jgi:ABC-2 type transport system permease protein